MPGSVTDKFRIASGSTRPIATTLSLAKAFGATTCTLTTATGWNTTTGLDYVMYRRQLNTTTGKYEETPGTRIEGRATLAGTVLSGMTIDAGAEPVAGYAADGNTVVICAATAKWCDDLVGGLLTHANQDGSLIGSAVRTALGQTASTGAGWTTLGVTPNTVTANGNRSYNLVFNASDQTTTLSPGMRLMTQRTVAAPTQCTSLNGTTQYFSKAAPAGMTFTNNFVVSVWVKLSSYATGVIASRFDGTNGWQFYVNSSGQVVLVGYNGGGANFSQIQSFQSAPLNKWVHVSAQLDMLTFTATTTTSYLTIDGVDVPASVTRGGTNPTALIQAGTFQVGAGNSASFFPGKIAQVAIYSAKVTQATILASMNQTLSGTETSLISAYSFNNTINDLNTTNANNLTANGSALATNADSPYGTQASGLISSTLDYGIIQSATFSTNTTLVVQVPEGCTIPTSGGVSAVSYSTQEVPYNYPIGADKWSTTSLFRIRTDDTTSTTAWVYKNTQIVAPAGRVSMNFSGPYFSNRVAGAVGAGYAGLSVSSSAPETEYSLATFHSSNVSSIQVGNNVTGSRSVNNLAQTTYYLITKCDSASTENGFRGDVAPLTITAIPAGAPV